MSVEGNAVNDRRKPKIDLPVQLKLRCFNIFKRKLEKTPGIVLDVQSVQ